MKTEEIERLRDLHMRAESHSKAVNYDPKVHEKALHSARVAAYMALPALIAAAEESERLRELLTEGRVLVESLTADVRKLTPDGVVTSLARADAFVSDARTALKEKS